ncbi:MAG: hypothetical protein NTU76_03530 [Candidatus Taylorbacteria bacterium]|nr:hypothetical protein [Candidatus Taylorbacteria bacterium]
MPIDRDIKEVEGQIRRSDIFHPEQDRIVLTESFVLPEVTVRTISKEQPDVILVGFDLGSPLFNGVDIIPIISECSSAYIIVNSEDDVRYFSGEEIRRLIDGLAGRDPQKLSEIIRGLLHH